MNYNEAMESTVTSKEAKREIEQQHGLCFSDFTAEHGIKSHYKGSDVLDWLGY